MAQKSIEERLSQLDSQRKALQARLIKQERAKDTRRKILLGALVLEKIDNGHEADKPLLAWLRTTLPGYLTRPDDKSLFDDLLKPAPDAAPLGAAPRRPLPCPQQRWIARQWRRGPDRSPGPPGGWDMTMVKRRTRG
jgi:hypothetical protein